MAVARRFDRFMRGHRFRQQEYRRLAREVVRMGVPPGGKVLDIGTGSGFLAIEVARRLPGTSCHVVGLNLSEAMLELAAHNARRRSLQEGLTRLAANAKAVPFNEGEFDVVASCDSLHHWRKPSPVPDEIARVLKEGRRYLIHDLKRPQQGLSRLVSWLIGMTIPPDLRTHHRNSSQAAYTSGELRSILERSRLQEWQIREELLDVTVVGRLG